MEDTSREATLILIRHGETIWNAQSRVQGQTNSPLSERGREQGRRAAERLRNVKLAAVYSSDLQRARETADLIAQQHNLKVVVSEKLRERSYGVLEGKTLEEAARTQGSWFLGWQADRQRQSPPAGETEPEMCVRVMEALRTIAGANPGKTVAIATHGGPIKSAVFEILHVPVTLWTLTFVTNGSLTTLRGTPDLLRLVTFNDTCHLDSITTATEEAQD